MRFVWGRSKARETLRRHGVDFADAAVALEDENALTIEESDHDEPRFKTLCMGAELNVLLVVHALRHRDTIRIISARKANRKQTQQYYQGLTNG